MKKTRFTEAQIMGILRQMEHGVPVSGLCREHGMSSATVYKWRAKYGGMDAMPYQRDEGNGRGEPPAEAHVRRRQHAERLAEGGSWKSDTASSAPRVSCESGGDDARIQFFDFIRHGSDIPFQ